MPKVIARVNDPRNQPHFDMLGITLTVSATATILALIEHELPEHELVTLLDLRRENLEIVEFAIDAGSPVAGRTVRELNLPSKLAADLGQPGGQAPRSQSARPSFCPAIWSWRSSSPGSRTS